MYCSGLGGEISPIKQVTSQLGTSNADKIMALGLSMLDQDINILTVDTNNYTSWNDVKMLYIELYQELIDGVVINEALLNDYQVRLETLKKE